MWSGVRLTELFRHDHFRTALRSATQLKFVHKSSHEESPAAGGLQKIFVRERIRHLMQVKAPPLIEDVHNELVVPHLKVQLNLLVTLLFISVAKGIDHAFPYRHADFQTVVIIEAGRSG